MIAWGLAWVGLSYRVEVRNSIVETQLQIDKNLEAALVSEGYLPRSVFDNRNRIRGFYFYPKGTALDESTHVDHLKQMQRQKKGASAKLNADQ